MERNGQHLLARVALVVLWSVGALGCTEVTAQPQEVVGETSSDGVQDADVEPESGGDLSSDLPSIPLDGLGPELPSISDLGPEDGILDDALFVPRSVLFGRQ